MSTVINGINNDENWQLLFTDSKTAVEATPKGGHYPIPAIEVPVRIDNRVIAVQNRVVQAKSTWRFGGNIIQRSQVGGGGSASPLPLLELEVCRLRINRTRLIVFEQFLTDYELIYETPVWFKNVSLTVWGYTGEVSDELKADLLRLESKVDSLGIY
jgi:hypothetical protein